MSSHKFWHVQLTPEFIDQMDKAPEYVQREYEDMWLEMQSDPEHGTFHYVFTFGAEYYMLFDWCLAALSYTIDDREARIVTIRYLSNPRLSFPPQP